MGTCSLDNSAKTLGAPPKRPMVRKPGLSDTGSRELFRSGFSSWYNSSRPFEVRMERHFLFPSSSTKRQNQYLLRRKIRPRSCP